MGKITETTDVNETKDDKLKVYCAKCQGKTNHLVMQSVDCNASEIIGYYKGRPEAIHWSDNYQIIQCQGCNSITFRQLSYFSEAVQQIGPDECDDGSSERLFPKRSNKTRPIKTYYNIPNTILRIYRETLECYNNEAVTLCAAGLRAIIEGICADQKVLNGPVQVNKAGRSTKIVRKKNLEGKIAGLGEKGILTQGNTVILHEHRFLGNEAVHELTQPSQDELILAIDIVEHTLEALYEMPDKADELRRIKARRKKKQNK